MDTLVNPEIEIRPATELSQVFTAALDEIDRRGWCQQYLVSPNGQVCLLGAVAAACGYKVRPGTAGHLEPGKDAVNLRLAIEFLARAQPGYVGWNDTPGRTVDEVRALLQRLALAA